VISLQKALKEPDVIFESIDMGEYPYGMRLNLGRKVLEELGLDAADLSIGGQVNLACKAKVMRLEACSMGREDGQSVELQITDLEIVDQNSSKGAFKEAFK
jgi:hypothetical protein